MAVFNLTVNEDRSLLPVGNVTSEQSNGCKTIWNVKCGNVYLGETMKVEVTASVGSYLITNDDPNYIFNTNYVTTQLNNVVVEIENSGVPGQFNSVTILISNITTGGMTSFSFTRYNDGGIC